MNPLPQPESLSALSSLPGELKRVLRQLAPFSDWARLFVLTATPVALILAASLVIATPESPAIARAVPLPMFSEMGSIANGAQIFDPQTAQMINAERPFTSASLAAASPFRQVFDDNNLSKAVDCLALTGIYEAGSGEKDQRAVMQVVLNRVSHVRFPDSVCGVVFQGSERVTGCQFTFTCDGSMTRWRPSVSMMDKARSRARDMLDGSVEASVGLATHYHTDWVVPYWSPSYEKLAQVGTHLFFGERGAAGRPAAFRRKAASSEPDLARLAAVVPIANETEVGGLSAVPDVSAHARAQLKPGVVGPALADEMNLETQGSPGRWSMSALSVCEGKSECKIVGWSGSRPSGSLNEAISTRAPDFIYVQKMRDRSQVAYWNCAKWTAPGGRDELCITSAAQVRRLLGA